MTDMNPQLFYGYEAGHAEPSPGLQARRERPPYVVEYVDQPEMAETMDDGINQFPVHEHHPMNQHHFRYVQGVDMPQRVSNVES